jgi:hypothetical protein
VQGVLTKILTFLILTPVFPDGAIVFESIYYCREALSAQVRLPRVLDIAQLFAREAKLVHIHVIDCWRKEAIQSAFTWLLASESPTMRDRTAISVRSANKHFFSLPQQ